jgi:diguanylate cyclase
MSSDELTLLGMVPNAPDSGFGYLCPVPDSGVGMRPVHRFVEKPDAVAAGNSIRAGSVCCKHSGLIDELCQLYNREGFICASAHWLKRWGRGAPWALLLSLQVNHLKVVHHALGQEVSAGLLMRTAVLLREVFRQAAVIGRLSEDEFAVLVRVASPSARTALISRLNAAIDAANASAGALSVSLSGGFSQFDPRYPVSITERLALADSAKRACAREDKG